MTVELDEVQDFLAANAPYAQLPARLRLLLTRSAEMRYYKRGSLILSCGEPNDFCWVIRSGAVDITDENGVLLDRGKLAVPLATQRFSEKTVIAIR